MLSFRTRGGARLSCRVDLAETGFANFSFFDAARREIRFHLSLRAAERLAVVNRHRAGAWGRELPHAVRFDPADVHVAFHFAGGHVTPRLDGRVLGRFDAFVRPDRQGRMFLRRGFPGLDGIAFVAFQGGVREDSVEIDGPANRVPSDRPALVLTDRLEIEGRGVGSGGPETAAFVLEVPGLEETPRLTARALPYLVAGEGPPRHAIGLGAPLPGRVWGAVADGADLELRLSRDGVPAAVLRLSRAGLAAHIETLAEEDVLREDRFAALQAIEHVRFAGLHDALSAPALTLLTDLAAGHGLTEFLFAGLPAPARTDTLAPREGGTVQGGDPVLRARDRILAALLADPRADPRADLWADPAALPARHVLPPEDRRALMLTLVEHFCSQDRFEELFALAGAEGLADFHPAPGGAAARRWHDTAILPFLCLQGRAPEIPRLLWDLVGAPPGWVVTPALSWVVRQILEPAHQIPDEKIREEVIYAYMGFIEHCAWDYWGRTPCLHLIDATVRLLGQGGRLADYMRDDIARFALRIHGLSRRFWERVAAEEEAGRLVLPEVLRAAHQAFAVIARRAGGGGAGDAEVSAALRLFERLDAPDAARFRRELLGPSGLPGGAGTAPDPTALHLAGLDPGEAALRHMAFPGAAPGGEELAALAARAVSERHDKIPRAPFYRLQVAAARRILALLEGAGPGAAEPAPGAVVALAGDLATLSGARNLYLGYGLGLSLLTGLLRAGALESGGIALDRLMRIRETLPETARAALVASPALRSALWGLRTACPSEPLALRALEIFADAVPGLPAAPGADVAPWPGASPLFDAIVVVFSCKAYLDSRIPALRAGWMGRLAALGVPCLVVVGDGDGRIEGDILHLDAPDDYEGLPEKTLAAIRWVHGRTAFAHMVKIDDDCFLDPDAFFHSLSYRKFDYYGRPLTREPGQTDRTWHMGKARSARGRLELDKSPEPSTYADGSTGWTLSRSAMAAALAAAESPEGRHLRRVSFMEDKLLGDLLALRGIRVADEDYRVAIFRRGSAGAPAVSRWVNSFLASRAAPLKLVHLDGPERQQEALETRARDILTPKKIWPGYMRTTLGYQSNALDLVSDAARLRAACAAPVAVIAVMRNEMFMLPHFLAHYRRLGVEAFLIADNGSDDGTLEHLAAQPDVALFSVDTDYAHSQYGVAWQQALLANFRVDRWSLLADADELLFWQEEPRETLPDLLAGPDFAGAEAARIFMLDMYPEGKLAAADFASGDPFAEAGFVERAPFLSLGPGCGPYSDAPGWTSALRHRLIPDARADLFVAQKLALLRYRPWMRLSAGLHYVADAQLSSRELLFGHFKYNAAFRAKAEAGVAHRQHFNDAEEYRKYLALIAEGREVIHDPAISVPWRDCAFVRRLLQPAAAQARRRGKARGNARGTEHTEETRAAKPERADQRDGISGGGSGRRSGGRRGGAA